MRRRVSVPILVATSLCGLWSPFATAQQATELDQWQDRVETELPKSFREFPDNRYRDPAVDRVVLFPTAETQPEGVWYASGHDGVAWTRLGVGVTDDLQLGAGGALAPWPTGSVTATYNVLRSRVRVAVVGGMMSVVVLGGRGMGPADAVPPKRSPYHVAHGGLVGQFCFDIHCRSSGVLGVHQGLELHWHEPVTLPHAGLVLRVSDYVAMLGEAALTHWQRDGRDYRDGWPLAPMEDWAALGVRIDSPSGRRISGDVSVVAAHQPGEILFFPWLGMTFRTDPINARPRPSP